jgi:hypothetical protein
MRNGRIAVTIEIAIASELLLQGSSVTDEIFESNATRQAGPLVSPPRKLPD